jgi:predicted acylesterase/phospholipase RssA
MPFLKFLSGSLALSAGFGAYCAGVTKKAAGYAGSSFSMLLKMIWLLFPAITFLFITYQCFWKLSQGQDVLIGTMEKTHAANFKNNSWIILIALLFYVFVIWYSSRVLVYRCAALFKNTPGLAFHTPRLLGFFGFSLIWIALVQLPHNQFYKLPFYLSEKTGNILLLLSVVLYFLLYKFFKWVRDEKLMPQSSAVTRLTDAVFVDINPMTQEEKKEEKAFKKIRLTLLITMVALIFLNGFAGTGTLLIITIIITQLLFLFFVIIRRGRLPFKNLPLEMTKESWMNYWAAQKNTIEPTWFGIVLYHTNITLRERGFFYVFNIFSIIALVFYFMNIFNMQFAMSSGAMVIVLLSLGVLGGFFAVVSIFSIIHKISYHFLLLLAVFILGKTREPHYARLAPAQDTTTNLATIKPNLTQYFLAWASQRKQQIQKGAEYPMLFMLADGGASRSGYWAATAMGRLEDGTRGKFSQHLFCLSGTSGGGVGHAVFFALLHNRDKMQGRSYEKEAKNYLKTDFLSYTLARMLGPDFFRPLIPFNLKNIDDRAGALETTLEKGADTSTLLNNKMDVLFKQLVPDIKNRITVPVLCINTTRMQDGRPGVISNLDLRVKSEKYNVPLGTFGKRLDVLDFIDHEKDIRLSTASIMGARFPYVSPAGRINEKTSDTTTTSHYFVDGGYFDNSGAGVVHEMIIGIQNIRDSLKNRARDTAYNYLDKLKFYVIHITNSPLGPPAIEPVNSIVNDLFSPVKTLVGAYGTQTDVNDSRLKMYLKLLDTPRYDQRRFYKNIDLYRAGLPPGSKFPMNWVISKYYLHKMDSLLVTSTQLNNLNSWINSFAY